MPRSDTPFKTALPIPVVGLVLAMSGCHATVGPKDGAVAQAIRIDSLESQVAALEVRLAESEAARDGARSVGQDSEISVPPGLPMPTRIIEASGSAVRLGREDDADVLQWRLRPEDARGRFVQVTGPAVVVAVAVADGGDPIELGRWEIDAAAWRGSLREGLLGSAYALDLELAMAVPANAQILLARIELDDVRVDGPFRLEGSVPIVRPLDRGETR